MKDSPVLVGVALFFFSLAVKYLISNLKDRLTSVFVFLRL